MLSWYRSEHIEHVRECSQLLVLSFWRNDNSRYKWQNDIFSIHQINKYCECLNFRGVTIFVVFVEGPIHEFQRPRNRDFLYRYYVHEFWTPRMCNFINQWKLVTTKLKPSTVSWNNCCPLQVRCGILGTSLPPGKLQEGSSLKNSIDQVEEHCTLCRAINYYAGTMLSCSIEDTLLIVALDHTSSHINIGSLQFFWKLNILI